MINYPSILILGDDTDNKDFYMKYFSRVFLFLLIVMNYLNMSQEHIIKREQIP
jgi:hypothetical protein